jgi:hypothetical protein
MSTDRAEWEAGMQAIHFESHGCLDLLPVLATDVPLIIFEASDNAEAYRILGAINNALQQIQDASLDQPALCGCCSRPLMNLSFSFLIARPANQPNTAHSLALAICEQCGTDHQSVEAAGVQALQHIWPDARRIAITHRGGTA